MTSRNTVLLIILAANALLGALFGYVVVAGALGTDQSLSRLSVSDLIAGILAALLFIQGAVVMLLGSFRRRFGFVVTGEDNRAASPAQIKQFRRQGLVLLLAGVMLGLPVLATWEGWLDDQSRMIFMAGLVACVAAQCFFNLRLWQMSDEFDQRLVRDTSAISFWMTSAPLSLWAAGERIGVLPALTSWDIAVLVMVVYLVASSNVLARSGAGDAWSS
jgi:hypothetical protein